MMTNSRSPTAEEFEHVTQANGSGRPVVVFVHGLWLLASSWDPWRELFDARGYATIAPGWPDDPATVEEGRRRCLLARVSVRSPTTSLRSSDDLTPSRRSLGIPSVA